MAPITRTISRVVENDDRENTADEGTDLQIVLHDDGTARIEGEIGHQVCDTDFADTPRPYLIVANGPSLRIVRSLDELDPTNEKLVYYVSEWLHVDLYDPEGEKHSIPLNQKDELLAVGWTEADPSEE